MMCLGGSHSFLEESVDLLCVDHFSNNTLVEVDDVAKQALILGKHAVHRLDFKDALQRKFSIEFEHE